MHDIASPVPAEKTLVDLLLAEQGSLTAVERFSQRHGSVTEPLLARHYRDLIPLTKPGKGEQYAFEVDLDACSGCKACVAACHRLNGLDDDVAWRDVGVLFGGTVIEPVQRTVTTACHHCADPGCMNGCPVLAYEKDPETGIVRHLDDQCIGCKYCQMKCPYEVPKYSKKRGIVRKCDMCQGRLAEGEAPACVQACPNEAIAIRVVSRFAIEKRAAAEGSLLPGTFRSSYTLPSTIFLSGKGTEGLAPADERKLRPAPAHFPLVAMLVLTQAAVGVSIFGGQTLIALVLAGLGLAASGLHLGQPLRAWRVFLGLKRSWLSREIVVFGLWIPLLAGSFLYPALRGPAIGVGLVGVFCSVMVYADTRRDFWRIDRGAMRFFGTACVLGAAFSAMPMWGAILATAKLVIEAASLLAVKDIEWTPAKRSALTLLGPLRPFTYARAASVALAWLPLGWPAVAALLLMGELWERVLFFKAVVEPKMPGGL